MRVRNFITQTDRELTPQWDDDVDDDDVKNLVHDISHNCIDHGFWDVNEEPPATTRKKRPKSVPETDVDSSKKKKASDTKTVGVEEDCEVLKVIFFN